MLLWLRQFLQLLVNLRLVLPRVLGQLGGPWIRRLELLHIEVTLLKQDVLDQVYIVVILKLLLVGICGLPRRFLVCFFQLVCISMLLIGAAGVFVLDLLRVLHSIHDLHVIVVDVIVILVV